MSVVAQLSTEVSNLISESRRRNNEIKHASERSLAVLKSFTPKESITELQFLKGLSSNPDFVTPFLLSCSSKNAKFSSIAIQSLNKLIQYNSIPISKIDILLDALIEATQLATDIQLKVLQILPSFYQIYGDFINNELLSKFFKICAILGSPNKSPMVINTSSATEQQIVLSLFDKIVEEDKFSNLLKDNDVLIYDDQLIKLSANAFDGFRTFQDYCTLITHQTPEFLPFSTTQESGCLELLENILNNYKSLFVEHEELTFLVKTKLTPILLRSFSTSKDYAIVVRVSRIILLLIKNQLSSLEIEAEVILSLLNLTLSKESNLPLWKKILSLEIFNSLFIKFSTIFSIFKTFDFQEGRKNIILDFLNNCSEFVMEEGINSLLNISDIVSLPSKDRAITLQNASLRIQYIDQLDKHDPPQAPKTYPLYLILNSTSSLCNSIEEHLLEIANLKKFSFISELSKEEQTSEIFQIPQKLISTSIKPIVSIGSEFVYSSLGSELFHSLIRSLQKLSHAAGVLSLQKERDSLLLLFAIATVSTTEKVQEARSSSISESIVETINYATGSVPSTPIKSHGIGTLQSRNLNLRHVICFRALASLSISLGPVLGDSWKFVLITFQWFDYYLNGPSKFLSFKDIPPAPELPLNDLKIIESTLVTLNESSKSYNGEQYHQLLSSLIEQAKTISFNSIDNDSDYFKNTDPIVNDEFAICPYNKDFFISKLGQLSQVNISRFLGNDNERDWELTFKFLSDLSSSQDVIPPLRVLGCGILNEILKELAEEGFSASNLTNSRLEIKIFKSLSIIIDQMLSSHSDELLVSNAESEMIHDTLKTLYELLDRFGTSFKNSWESIVQIIDSPFKFYELSKSKNNQQKQLLKSSFEILQLILNDFLQSIPLNNFKLIIDVLQNFCLQEVELNVSFSAVSYYWLISDYFRGLVANSEEAEFEVETRSALTELINNTEKADVKLRSLWLYLLSSLVKISDDTRVEVKNGAVQTFFRIIDSHGIHLNWNRTFDIVVRDLLNIKLTKPKETDFETLKMFKDNTSIVLKGVTDIYCRFITNLTDEKYWAGLLGFFQRLVELDVVDISKAVYKSTYQILQSFNDITAHNFVLFFNFWYSQSIKYISNETDSYQDMAIEYIKIFERLNDFGKLTRDQLELSISIFNNAIRFPFLPRFVNDAESSTKLQNIILDSLQLLSMKSNGDLLLVNLSSLVLLPFQTRSRILKKLTKANKDNLSSFIHVSIISLQVLENKIDTINDFSKFINDSTFTKVYKNLIDVVKSKVEDDKRHSSRLDQVELWKKSLSLLLKLTEKISPLLRVDEESTQNAILWSLIIDTTTLVLPGRNDERDEEFNLKCYEKFRDIILENLNQRSLKEDFIKELISSVWNASFLYENDELETFLFENSDSPSAVTDALLTSNVIDYSTEPITALSQQRLRLICLKDLFKFTTENIENSGSENKLLVHSFRYLICRIVLIIKRFSCSQRLLNRSPVSTIQQTEITLTLEKLYELLKTLKTLETLKNSSAIISIFPLILENQQYLGRLDSWQPIITGITAEFYQISKQLNGEIKLNALNI
ncbi:hypothetical protein WICMUC_000928 [Wickerhamomyces mucosus]|uniref:Protein MON2 n=1 Tax=Wickerhamomyces mucosus TaxID=1378264 RepID=A0A9P8PW26_9ASCO|nr:hypothetical protein WICMUC_000928 [Wickerhamomyces mucosus]